MVGCEDTDRALDLFDGKTVVDVLLTHMHSDLIYGLEDLMVRFPVVKISPILPGVEALRSPHVTP